MMKSSWIRTSLWFLSLFSLASAIDYVPDIGGASINLEDEATSISGLRTIFKGDSTLVNLEGIAWSPGDANATATSMTAQLYINGEAAGFQTIDLPEDPIDLPTSIQAGTIIVDKIGRTTVSVDIFLDDSKEAVSSTSSDYQTITGATSLVPLIIILILALTTQMVELSLFAGIWLGACILTGSLAEGFKVTIIEFLVGALSDEYHVQVILFTVFLAGAIGMMQKSGGMKAFTESISKVANTPRAGQFACMGVGLIIFFDDYANLLLTGETMKPLLDVLFVSREKLSFIVDATSAPIASISPISSWVGFEVGLVQDAINDLKDRLGEGEELTIPDTGFAVFLQSIRYSYYSLFMIGLIAMLIATQRDYGPMLVAERKVRCYDRQDGGPGATTSTGESVTNGHNQPREDQPLFSHNFLVPIVVWIALVFALLVNTGTVPGTNQTFFERIESGDSYLALLYGTMGTAWIAMILYLVQITIPGTGELAIPTPSLLMDMMPWNKKKVEERGDQPPRFLLSINESIEAFLFGMARIFLALVILTLAWACGAIMTTVGTDRLFSSWITGGGIPYQVLPMLTFVIAILIALSTGTSWGTMTILFPLLLVPTYQASGGEPEIFYATVSAVMGGAVAGDHMSPISDTTVLTSLACEVNLMKHVNTQAPYVFWVVLFAVLLGYLPMGYGAYPNIVGILLGWVACGLFVFFICVPVMSPTGSWDIVNKLCCGRSEELKELAEDCIKKASGEEVVAKEVESAPSSELKEEVEEEA